MALQIFGGGSSGGAAVTVGTTPGTVAAGNDSRIVNAAQIGNIPSPPLVYGSAKHFRKWHAKLAAVRAGVGFAKIMCVGDSTTQGGTNATSNVTSAPYPARLAAMLDAYLVPAKNAWWNPKGDLAGDSRLTATGGWGWNGAFGMGNGSAFLASGGTGTLTFTPGFNTDTLEVYYLANSGNGSVAVNVDGGATISTVATSGTIAIVKATITTTLGAHVWNLVGTAVTGNVLITTMRAYDSTTKQVHVGNFGRSGSFTSDWANTSNAWQQPYGIDIIAPDLTIVSLGVNDAATPVSLATYQANMTTVINRAKLTGDVLLCGLVPSDPAAGATRATNEGTYSAAMLAFAQSLDVPFLDAPWDRWGSTWALANSSGYMADSLHPNATGYADWAQALVAVLRQV